MKNKNKYNLRKIEWEVSRNKNTGYKITYSTKVYYHENGRKVLLASLEGGSHIDFLNWLEKEANDD